MARPAQDPKVRFEKFVVPSDTGCHEFTSTIQKDGYGRFFFKGRQAPAHRVSYELHVGSIPNGMMVCHRCDNRCCVNPEHLFLGTSKDNAMDMVVKGRITHRRKTNDEQVRRVLHLRAEGWSQERIGEAVGVDQTNVSRILRRVPMYMTSFVSSHQGA